MTHFAPIKAVSYLLYLSIIVHAIYALIITIRNKKARPIAYAKYDGNANSKWNSRNMGILGTIILVFLVVHMGDFWYKYHWGEDLPHIEYRTNIATGITSSTPLSSTDVNEYISYVENGEKVVRAKDLYKVVEFSFQTWYLVLFYLLAMVALGFHLAHGFKSAFATLGFRHNRYTPIIQFLGLWIFGVLIPLGFALMPLYFFFK
jgi:succinate dehydrogenase / fumarate reductase cytochrome b subunit